MGSGNVELDLHGLRVEGGFNEGVSELVLREY